MKIRNRQCLRQEATCWRGNSDGIVCIGFTGRKGTQISWESWRTESQADLTNLSLLLAQPQKLLVFTAFASCSLRCICSCLQHSGCPLAQDFRNVGQGLLCKKSPVLAQEGTVGNGAPFTVGWGCVRAPGFGPDSYLVGTVTLLAKGLSCKMGSNYVGKRWLRPLLGSNCHSNAKKKKKSTPHPAHNNNKHLKGHARSYRWAGPSLAKSCRQAQRLQSRLDSSHPVERGAVSTRRAGRSDNNASGFHA